MGGFWKLCFDPQKEQQIKIEGEFKPTVDCLCATRRGLVAVYEYLTESREKEDVAYLTQLKKEYGLD